MHPIAERIYNTVIDQLTLKLSKRSFTVAISQSYPDDGKSKYIIWQRKENPQFYLLFMYKKDEDYLELYKYDEGDISKNGTEGLLDPSYPYWCYVYRENISIYIEEETQEDYTSEDEEEFIISCIRGFISAAIIATYSVTPEYKEERKNLPPPAPDPEKEAVKIVLKDKRRYRIRLIAKIIGACLILGKLMTTIFSTDKVRPEHIDNKSLTNEQIHKILRLQRMHAPDSTLMKDTSRVYYRYKKKLEQMNDSLQ